MSVAISRGSAFTLILITLPPVSANAEVTPTAHFPTLAGANVVHAKFVGETAHNYPWQGAIIVTHQHYRIFDFLSTGSVPILLMQGTLGDKVASRLSRP